MAPLSKLMEVLDSCSFGISPNSVEVFALYSIERN
jgi:hypothetical protein